MPRKRPITERAKEVVRKTDDQIRLDEIGTLCGTDKSSRAHGYLDFYERFFAEIKYENIKLLEIGVFTGQSARMWELYFPFGQITGLDINPITLKYGKGRVKVVLADQSDEQQLTEIGEERGGFDIIIDDGSHIWEHQKISFRSLFRFLVSGGFYVIEDLQVCTPGNPFYEQCKGTSTVSTVQYLQRLNSYVLGKSVPDDEQDQFLRSAAFQIDFIAFAHGTALIAKK